MNNFNTLILFLFAFYNLPAQIVNIPDPAFESYLLMYNNPVIDTNGDMEIQVSEAQAVTTLHITSFYDPADLENITDLTGLESFVNLEYFTLADADQVTSLDLSHQTNLIQFDLYNDPLLTCLNIHNTNNTNIDAGNSHLENLANLEYVCLDDPNYLPFVIVGGAVGNGNVTYTSDCSTMLCIPSDPPVNIPDNNLYQAILNDAGFIDANGDNIIQLSEAQNTLSLNELANRGISDTTGLEAFTNITTLNISNNNITVINLDQNTELNELNISYNQIQEINLSQLSDLQFAYFNHNLFQTLDFSNQVLLDILQVNDNFPLTYVNIKNGNSSAINFDFSNLPHLEYVCVDDANDAVLTGQILNQTGHPVNFVDTNCGITLLNVYVPDATFKNILLADYDTNNDGEIQSFEVNTVTELLVETYDINDLTGIEAFTDLQHLNCMENNLQTLDVSSNSALTWLECQANVLSQITFGNNPQLNELDFSNNLITDIDLTNLTSLTDLFCYNNQLETIDLSNNPIIYLMIRDNLQLTYINLHNGNNQAMVGGEFTNLPLLETVCVDDLSFTDLTNYIISQVGHPVNFIDNCATGIEENMIDAEVNIYPNPVVDLLSIETTVNIKHLKVYNLLGEELIDQETEDNLLNVSGLNRGMYFVKIIDDKQRSMYKRFVKQ